MTDWNKFRGDVKEPRVGRVTGWLLLAVLFELPCVFFAWILCYLTGLLPLRISEITMTHDERMSWAELILGILLFGPALWRYVFLSSSWRRSGMRRFAIAAGFDCIDLPKELEGFDITVGSVIAKGADTFPSCSSLMSSTKNGYRWRAVNYGYQRGKSMSSQTVLCVDITGSHLTPFSLIHRNFLYRATEAKMSVWESAPKNLSKKHVVVVDTDNKSFLSIPAEFLRICLLMPDFNVEYLGDRLLVYGDEKILKGSRFLECLDRAIELAEALK